MNDDFEELRRAYGGLNRSEYLNQCPHPILFQACSEDGQALPLEAQRELVNRKTRRLTKNMLRTPLDTGIFILSDFSPVRGRVLTIVNKPENANRSFIGIGRDPSCDVQIDDPSVDPRHGFFMNDDGTTLTDAGSQHGTFIRGGPLASRASQKLMNHDDLRFGEQVGLIFFSPHGFYEFLKASSLALSS